MRIREVVPEADYIRVAELISSMEPEPWTAAALHEQRLSMAPGQIAREMVAERAGGCITGMSVVTRLPWWSPGRFGIVVIVDPAVRGQGIGTRLYAEALAWAEQQGSTRPESRVRDDDALSLRFAQKQGYRIDRHLFNSALELADFDPAPFAGVVDDVKQQGIRFFTMADLGDTLEARRKMYEVNRACTLDIPGRERTFSDFEQYQKRNFSSSSYRPELHLFAA
ncbi:MAG TPA: GNAT family N-acetyltransferase, partial [Symbiobacteriaceae bacterium]|nr:GNAT family N-acetyltransferase [Symbiobacteriaceae bacterium]